MTSERRARIAAESAPTTPSAAATAPQRRLQPPRSRVRWIRHAVAVVAGATIGGGLALYAAPAGSPAPVRVVAAQAGPPAGAATLHGSSAGSATPAGSSTARPVTAVAAQAGPSAGVAAAPSAASAGLAVLPGSPAGTATLLGTSAGSATPASSSTGTGADPRAAAVAQVKDAVRRFALWSRDHLGAQCPDAAALGVRPLDPWSRPLRIVCADQPIDQIAGVLSLGPDGLPGTPDDVASWALGSEVTDLLRGPRWARGRSASASPGGSRVAPGSRTTTPRATASATSPAASRTTNSGAAPAAPASTAAASPAARPPATPISRPAAVGAGSDDIDGDGIPDRR